MIVTAAVVPHPPLLLAELAGAAAAETAALRDACCRAVSHLSDVSRRVGDGSRWLAIGAGPRAATYGPDARGTFAGFGADVRVALGPDAGAAAAPDPDLPLPVLVAGWLRGQVAPEVSIEARVLPATTSAGEARRIGEELGAADGGTVLLVLGDGAATHTARAPGAFDERAGPYEQRVVDALATGDAATLAGLDAGLGAELMVAGRVPWQVLAAAMPHPSRTDLTHTSTPYGVAYHVATWDA